MQKKSRLAILQAEIVELEEKRRVEWIMVKSELEAVSDNINIGNIIKQTILQPLLSPEIKPNLMNALIGLTTGYFAKNMVIGNTSNVWKKMLGFVFEIIVANSVVHQVDKLKEIGLSFFNKIKPSVTTEAHK